VYKQVQHIYLLTCSHELFYKIVQRLKTSIQEKGELIVDKNRVWFNIHSVRVECDPK